MTERPTTEELLSNLLEKADNIEAGLAGLVGHFERRFARLERKFDALAKALTAPDLRH